MLTKLKSEDLERLISNKGEEEKNKKKDNKNCDDAAANVDGVGCVEVKN